MLVTKLSQNFVILLHMEATCYIAPPADAEDAEGAQRVFREFLTFYQPSLVSVEYYLERVIEEVDPVYADAYRPWYQALHDLFSGASLIAKNNPLPDPDGFLDALRTFRFDSAACFLSDLCVDCQQDWAQHFREHIDMLLLSFSILNRKSMR